MSTRKFSPTESPTTRWIRESRHILLEPRASTPYAPSLSHVLHALLFEATSAGVLRGHPERQISPTNRQYCEKSWTEQFGHVSIGASLVSFGSGNKRLLRSVRSLFYTILVGLALWVCSITAVQSKVQTSDQPSLIATVFSYRELPIASDTANWIIVSTTARTVKNVSIRHTAGGLFIGRNLSVRICSSLPSYALHVRTEEVQCFRQWEASQEDSSHVCPSGRQCLWQGACEAWDAALSF